MGVAGEPGGAERRRRNRRAARSRGEPQGLADVQRRGNVPSGTRRALEEELGMRLEPGIPRRRATAVERWNEASRSRAASGLGHSFSTPPFQRSGRVWEGKRQRAPLHPSIEPARRSAKGVTRNLIRDAYLCLQAADGAPSPPRTPGSRPPTQVGRLYLTYRCQLWYSTCGLARCALPPPAPSRGPHRERRWWPCHGSLQGSVRPERDRCAESWRGEQMEAP
jgi:hypothetical protein